VLASIDRARNSGELVLGQGLLEPAPSTPDLLEPEATVSPEMVLQEMVPQEFDHLAQTPSVQTPGEKPHD